MTRYKVSFEVESNEGWQPWEDHHELKLGVYHDPSGYSGRGLFVPASATVEVIEEEPDSGFYVSRGSTATYQYDDGTWWVWTGNSWSTVNNKPNGTLHKLSPK